MTRKQVETFALPLSPENVNPLRDEPLVVVKPVTRRHSNARFLPENASLLGFDIQLHRVEEAGIYGDAVWQFRNDPERAALAPVGDGAVIEKAAIEYVEDQVVAGFEVLSNTSLPLIGYNLFNYGWRVVAADGIRRRHEVDAGMIYDFSGVIPRTIDLQDVIVETAFRARAADSSLPPVTHGAFGLDSILEHNDVSLVAPNSGFPPDSIGALWYFMAAGGQVSVQGIVHELPEDLLLCLRDLECAFPRFSDAGDWMQAIVERGWTRDYYVRNYKSIKSRLAGVYGIYLAAN